MPELSEKWQHYGAEMTGSHGVEESQGLKAEKRMLVVFEAEFFHFLDQGCTIHMQQVCRLALNPACFHKGLHEELFFKRFDHSVKVNAVVWDGDARDTLGDTGAEDFLGKIFR